MPRFPSIRKIGFALLVIICFRVIVVLRESLVQIYRNIRIGQVAVTEAKSMNQNLSIVEFEDLMKARLDNIQHVCLSSMQAG